MKQAFLILVMLVVGGNALGAELEATKEPIVLEPVEKAQDYWVYVRLEDRSGVTPSDDVGRSKAGDVVAVLPVTPQHIPSETEKKEWMIYKTSLTEVERQGLLETWEETDVKNETFEIAKETWENAEKKQEFLTSVRSVEVISEYLYQTEVDTTGYRYEVITTDGETLTGDIEGTVEVKEYYAVEIQHEYQKPIAYRKNKLDTSKLGVTVKKGLVSEPIDSLKIETSVKTAEDFARYELKRKFYAYVQRPLKIVSNKIIPPAFAETVSTINKTGEDYNTLALWEDAVDGDLVTATSQPTAHCYNDDGNLAEAELTIDGSTTNSSYYMKITVPSGERHNGTSDESGFILATVCDGDCSVINLFDNYTVVEWLDITNLTSTGNVYTYFYGLVLGSNYSVVRNNIIHGFVNFRQKFSHAIGSEWWGGNYCEIYGNSLWNLGGGAESSAMQHAIWMNDDTYVKVYNNTIYDFQDAGGTDAEGINVNNSSSTNVVKNNLVIMTEGDAYNLGASVTADYNGSSDSSELGENSVTSLTSSVFVSTTTGSENLHLTVGAGVIDEGVDLGSPYNIDIDGTTRSGTWDIGADEYVSATRRRMMIIQ